MSTSARSADVVRPRWCFRSTASCPRSCKTSPGFCSHSAPNNFDRSHMRASFGIAARDVDRLLLVAIDLAKRANGHPVARNVREQEVTFGCPRHGVRLHELVRRHAAQLSCGAGDEIVDAVGMRVLEIVLMPR